MTDIQNTHFTYKILKYTSFNLLHLLIYIKWVCDMFQYNKLSDCQNARFHILEYKPPCWTLLVMWYPHWAVYNSSIKIIENQGHNKEVGREEGLCRGHIVMWVSTWRDPGPLHSWSVSIKFIVYCWGSGYSWLICVVNGITDSMLCMTNFLVLHSTTCGEVCIHQQAGQSNTMKEHS